MTIKGNEIELQLDDLLFESINCLILYWNIYASTSSAYRDDTKPRQAQHTTWRHLASTSPAYQHGDTKPQQAQNINMETLSLDKTSIPTWRH
ncbi:hypothetical protein TNCV_4073281 [Trichonephila clavipes]|uniref:Uncharacterized protein n=1 Tax=Trichonephila clavipes TaxID=2585209 RepID=A0A8X7BG30_TRICX|nr:hypothetical protein TNCV_4073281 [Trichonephila clavipes]